MNVLKVGTNCYPVESIAAASDLYARLRDESGEGASSWRDGELVFNGTRYRISYNGKVWNAGPFMSGARPVFDPYADPIVAPAVPLSAVRVRHLLHNDVDALVDLYRAEFPNGRIKDPAYYELMAQQLTRKARQSQKGAR